MPLKGQINAGIAERHFPELSDFSFSLLMDDLARLKYAFGD